ncbi:phospholipid/cholesterol/gamma-HCH transport system substrate-binding protein [Methylomarinovum tepidoasis]|uniref:Phospholipid/cholesterol/gamma-HCH transport system substrate-binding protein n=1 Tax=Methylomarinovum tepidoasis TaxID=2840183 RepID=A0AAU9D1P2_9GAMM|nr:outer membrane lipid asymmetry maintenance protein MlaD [Methylomarinovum sp. IN45]BCX88899.1 phospholipid/cholesterol/gamma-HCH transport system substrate-binding protein [Methylomarinovum sp. IN45]
MEKSRLIEIWVGIFVAIGLGALFLLAMEVSNLTEFRDQNQGYRLYARFQNIGTLKVRAPVKLAGVPIGRVSRISLDPERYEAVVEMRIQPAYKLPDDSIASIYTSGLLGEQYVGIDAGGSPDYFEDGDEIEITQSALVLEELIGKFLVKSSEKSGTQ